MLKAGAGSGSGAESNREARAGSEVFTASNTVVCFGPIKRVIKTKQPGSVQTPKRKESEINNTHKSTLTTRTISKLRHGASPLKPQRTIKIK
jgi:hypothetical protein